MASYTIKIEGGATFPCDAETYILDAAEEQGIDLRQLPHQRLHHPGQRRRRPLKNVDR
jgi:hypothetical protein